MTQMAPWGRRSANAAAAVALVAGMCLPAAPAPAGELGRLFTTVQQRRQLDELRQQADLPEARVTLQRPADAPEAPDSPVNPLTVRGVVKRELGPSAAWINDTSTLGGDLASEYLQLKGSDIGPGSVQLPGSASPVEVKVGETLDPLTGTVADSLSAGGHDSAGTPEPGEANAGPGQQR